MLGRVRVAKQPESKGRPEGPRKKVRMKDLGWIAETVHVKPAMFHAWTRRVQDMRISKAEHARRLLEADLVKAGYLVRSELPVAVERGVQRGRKSKS